MTSLETVARDHVRRRKIVSRKELVERYGITYSHVHFKRLGESGRFPAALQIGPSRIGWYEDEVELWIANLPRAGEEPEAA